MKNGRSIISYLKSSIRVIAKVTLGILVLTGIFGGFYWFNNTLFLWEAKILWPKESFSEVKFKTGSTDRARMVVDLIQSKKLVGIESNKIPLLLGEETGDYYHSDSVSTYRLTDQGKADWILTFVPGDDGKIEHIFIRKSCCSVSKRILYLSLELADPLIKNLIKLHPK